MAVEELEDKYERREHPRFAVDIQIEARSSDEIILGLMVDISIAGLRIRVPKFIRPDTDIMVFFSTADEVNILTRTVWALEETVAGLPSYMVGLKIHSIMVNKSDIQGMAARTDFLQKLLH